jgi:hypothetical protein
MKFREVQERNRKTVPRIVADTGAPDAAEVFSGFRHENPHPRAARALTNMWDAPTASSNCDREDDSTGLGSPLRPSLEVVFADTVGQSSLDFSGALLQILRTGGVPGVGLR